MSYFVSVLRHPFMFILKRSVLPVLKFFPSYLLQCVDFRTNCDYLIANCNSPMPCHTPQPEKLRFSNSLLKKHLVRALEMAIRCFLTSSTQWGRCENVGRGITTRIGRNTEDAECRGGGNDHAPIYIYIDI